MKSRQSSQADEERLHRQVRALFGPERSPRLASSFRKPLSHYKLLKKLGSGARGTVYLARDRQLKRLVAIKALRSHSDAESRGRFLREAESAAALTHPNIVAIYELLHHKGADFIVMEYVAGHTLSELIGPRGLPLKSCLGYAGQMAQALAAVHSAKMIHRDLKPAHFVVTDAGVIKLLDFGLAKVVGGRRSSPRCRQAGLPETRDGAIMGTPGYMSPEQVRGHAADHRSDVFSFGAILYEMLSGRRAFKEQTPIETMTASLRKMPLSLPGHVPEALAKIVRRCLAKDPNKRYKTGHELAHALARLTGCGS